ncbi:unnamed protein product [Allacma fusca]|uniref:Uncharacterized protein n=1 Tax=Allacma fusca TaxID=39272 RepID=A0A8J2LMM3_9HEXA|nr:unnamed protein product [Allacma fusca]
MSIITRATGNAPTMSSYSTLTPTVNVYSPGNEEIDATIALMPPSSMITVDLTVKAFDRRSECIKRSDDFCNEVVVYCADAEIDNLISKLKLKPRQPRKGLIRLESETAEAVQTK